MKLLRRILKILSGVSTGAEEEISRLEHGAHFCVLVAKSFVRNRCPVRAAALSYTTLLAFIPMLAVAISVTSSLLKTQGEEKIYTAINKLVSSIVPPDENSLADSDWFNEIYGDSDEGTPVVSVSAQKASSSGIVPTGENLPADSDWFNEIYGDSDEIPPVVSVSAQKAAAKWIHKFIEKTQSGTLGVVGMLLLLYVAITMLANIEATFNDIWGVTRGRTWLSRIILYWATITLGPLLLAGALALASSPHFEATKGAVSGTIVGGFIFQLMPLAVVWLAFALIYQLVPHTKIHFSAALVGGIVGGTLWHLNNVFGFLYASRVVSYSKVYGSLGLVPVFMAGLYLSWLILLFGAQVAYAFQNRRSYLQDKLIENVNQRGREFIALRLMTCIGQRFNDGQPPLSLQKISLELGIPSKLVQQVMQSLLTTRLVVETGGNEHGYTPARPLDTITAHDVLHAMRTGTGQELPMRDNPIRAEVYGEFARIEKAEREAAATITLLELVNRATAKLTLFPPEPEGSSPPLLLK